MADPVVREQQVTFSSEGLTLAGSFTVPKTAPAGTAPTVLLLPGSGETDRNDDAKRLAINAFPPLVRALDELGVVTFRYDKRGVGASQGDYPGTGFDDRLTDAVAAVAWMRGRPEVDLARVFVLGHSEGALIATPAGGRCRAGGRDRAAGRHRQDR